MYTFLLLLASNLFMTAAWYGHLKHTDVTLWKVILISWGIAFFEYCLQVPANRMGYGQFTGFQLKIMQECLSIGVFILFAILYLKEQMTLNHLICFGLLLLAAWFGFSGGAPKTA